MKIIVLMKQVPDMQMVKFDYENKKIDRSSAGVEINPYDLNALEMAIQISEKVDAEVIAVSMGPDRGKEVIVDAMARGADRGILVSDRKFGGADTKATAMTLKAVIESLGPLDLIICGEKTVDGDTGQVGSELAEYLGIPQISYVENLLDIDMSKIIVKTNIMESIYEIESKFPVLLTVTKDVNYPRLQSIKEKLKARKKDIPKITFDELEDIVSEEQIGSKGSPTKVVKIEIVPPLTRQTNIVKFEDGIDGYLDNLLEELIEDRILEVGVSK